LRAPASGGGLSTDDTDQGGDDVHPDAAPDRTPPSGPDTGDDTGHDTRAEDIEPVKDLLDAHVPLTLLVDLFTDAAPPSTEILESEGLPDTPWWEQDAAAVAAPDEPGT
jgi:hypothetical protein